MARDPMVPRARQLRREMTDAFGFGLSCGAKDWGIIFGGRCQLGASLLTSCARKRCW